MFLVPAEGLNPSTSPVDKHSTTGLRQAGLGKRRLVDRPVRTVPAFLDEQNGSNLI
jgi:hypothetical protein